MSEELSDLAKIRATATICAETLQNSKVLEMLTEDEQIRLLNSIFNDTSYNLDSVLEENISFMSALNVIQKEDDYLDYLTLDNEHIIASAITFENSHRIAYALATGPELSAAKALYLELKYWSDQGRFD